MKTAELKAEYTVDLSRDEYVRSQEILSRNRGARNPQIVTLLLLIVCVVTALPNVVYNGEVNWSMLVLLSLLVLSEVWMLVTLSSQLRNRHEEAYNATVYNGYTFAGTVTVEADAVRKRTESATAVIPYEQCRLFVETADMMIFYSMEGKSIVIPSRFLTEQTAEATRLSAFEKIPPTRRMLLAPLIPTADEANPFVVPSVKESEEVLLTVDVEYTDSELVGLVTDMALEDYAKTLPGKSLWMTVLASVGYFLFAVRPLPLFLLSMLVLFLLAVAKARIKIRRVITDTERAACRLRVEFTDSAVHLIGKVDGSRPMRLPWQHITRAVDCRHTVELYTGKVRQLSVPKRSIKDFEELCRIVDSHIAPKA